MNDRWTGRTLFGKTVALVALATASCDIPHDRWEPAEGATEVEPPRTLIKSATHACNKARYSLPEDIEGFVKVGGEEFREYFAKLREPGENGSVIGRALFYNMLGRWDGNEVGYIDGQNFEVEGPPAYVVVGETICHFVSWKIISVTGITRMERRTACSPMLWLQVKLRMLIWTFRRMAECRGKL